jgi:hypothetical protein
MAKGEILDDYLLGILSLEKILRLYILKKRIFKRKNEFICLNYIGYGAIRNGNRIKRVLNDLNFFEK